MMRSGPAGKKDIWWEDELDLAPAVWPSRRRWPARAWGWVGLMAACPALFAVAAVSLPREACDALSTKANLGRRAVTVLTFLPRQVEIERRGRAGDIDPHIIVLRSEDMDRRIIVQVGPDMDRRIVAELPEPPALRLGTLPALTSEGGTWLVLPPCRAG